MCLPKVALDSRICHEDCDNCAAKKSVVAGSEFCPASTILKPWIVDGGLSKQNSNL